MADSIKLNITMSCHGLAILAAEVITPGMLIVRDANGLLIPNNVVDLPSPTCIAVEDTYSGKTIDEDYEIGQMVFATYARRGDVLLLWLKSNVTVVGGDLLSSNGDGMLKLAPASPVDQSLIGVALEGITGGVDPVRIKVEII